MEAHHKPVLLGEVVEALGVESGKWFLDATLGEGGHSLEILNQGGNIVGIDVDPEALERAKKRFQDSGISENRFRLIQGNFRDLKNLTLSLFAKTSRGKQTETKFKGLVFDLGVSSLQLDSPKRGFSFSKNGPLDMRMDLNLSVTATDLVNVLNKGELYDLFTKFGEEKFARTLAETLVSTREIKKGKGISTTKELADFVERVYRQHGIRKWRVHPATRVFQALRIAVNDELNALREVLPQTLELMEKNGHIVIISFHSLEDRTAKYCFRDWEAKGLGQILTRKPIIPGETEIRENPRSRSAKMRVFEII